MKPLKVILISCMCLFAVLACKTPQEENDYQQLLEQVEINPAFEQSPPIASDFAIEVLENPLESGENVRFTATFGRDLLRDAYLAVLAGDEKVVLRDDGKGADIEEGDGVFSVFLQQDLDDLRQELENRKKTMAADERLVRFENRFMHRLDPAKIRAIEIGELIPGSLIKLPPDIFIGGLRKVLDASKTLMITDLSVIEDPTRTFNPCSGVGNPAGPWTFGQLMREMASTAPGSPATDAEVSAFVLNWLNTWTVSNTVNGESLPARTAITAAIIDPWLARSAAAGAPAGELKMEFAPFRLLAIVNRLDLRGNSGYGFSDAGEGRFVFCAMNEGCVPLSFNVIFEYGINKKSCSAVKAFAQEWADLDGLTLGSPAYNNALQAITDQFTKCGTNSAKPNQSSLNQLRTNEIAIGAPWELREFNLDSTPAELKLVTVKMEPAVKYNAKVTNVDVERLVDFINSNTADIEANNYNVPETISTPGGPVAFLGGKSHTSGAPTGTPPGVHHWDGTAAAGSPTFVTSDSARFIFSLNTCSGCHGGETQTFFTHIDPAPFGATPGLSGFLTGTAGAGGAIDFDGLSGNNIMTVRDAANRPPASPDERGFNDLQRREQDLSDLLTRRCGKFPLFDLGHLLAFKPLKMTH